MNQIYRNNLIQKTIFSKIFIRRDQKPRKTQAGIEKKILGKVEFILNGNKRYLGIYILREGTGLKWESYDECDPDGGFFNDCEGLISFGFILYLMARRLFASKSKGHVGSKRPKGSLR